MRTTIKRVAVIGAAAVLGAAVIAPTAQAAKGETSLASVLQVGQAAYDRGFADFDILTKAAETVLAAKPNSNVKLLADGSVALTVFAPTDQAFMNLAAAFTAVAGLGVDTLTLG
jgi:uncharacterized surface protein with fasciclin (FAS1) repeats